MNKKKILALSLIVCLLATAVVGGTLAYFTDTDDAVNTFTAGNVGIDLTEAEVMYDADGNLVAAGGRMDVGDAEHDTDDVYDYGKVYPGQTILKDPTITVDAGSEDCYVAAKVIVTDGVGDLHKIIGVKDYDNLDIHKLVSGGEVAKTATQLTGWNGLSMVYETETSVIYQEANRANGEYVFYVFVKDPMAAGESVVLFDHVNIDSAWDNEEMAELVDLKIEVQAYATQEYGFHSCFDAITAAFDDDFHF